MLKKDSSIRVEKIIIFILEFKTDCKSLTGKKPPEDMSVKAKFNDVNALKSKIFKIVKIKKVNKEYKINIFKDCLKISDVLNEKKFVKDFFKLLSKISINKIIENKK